MSGFPNNPVAILEFAYLSGGFTTRSDFARNNAEMVAQLGQRGFLTTDTPRDGYSNVWRLTADGHEVLFEVYDLVRDLREGCPHALDSLADLYNELGLPQEVYVRTSTAN